ncbi:MAG: hypothetical protein ACKO2G_07740 [Verrucomicrobiales bacterium]
MKKSLFVLAAAIAAGFVSTARASWTVLPLPNTQNFTNTALGHLPDGRFVYGHNGNLIRQDTFGASTATPYTNAPAGDSSFITSTHIGYSNSGTRSYDGTNTATTFNAAIAPPNNPYAGVNYGSGALLMVGSQGFGSSALYHISSGGTITTLITAFSDFSGGIAMDDVGNVYLAHAGLDANDNNIYRYTAAQITTAIAGTPLTLANGTFVANLGVSGYLAVDSTTNRLYASGYQINGIRVLDLGTSETGTLVAPGFNNSNYASLATFTNGGTEYLGWVNRAGFGSGDAVSYGYAPLSTLPIPEPGAAVLGLAGVFMLGIRRRRISA